ncbi:unnamed protein product [Ixodes pacificus]
MSPPSLPPSLPSSSTLFPKSSQVRFPRCYLLFPTPRRTDEDRQSERGVLRAADPLALQQDAAHVVPGAGARGGCLRRHAGHPPGGQRRELLRGAEERVGRHEEPGGQVQRPPFRRQEREG